MTSLQNHDRLHEDLTAFSAAVEGTSLYLLRAINQTVDSLQAREKLADATAQNCIDLSKRINEREPIEGRYLDSEDVIIDGIETAYKSLEEKLPSMVLRKASIDKDKKLNQEQCELLHSAYDLCMTALANLIEASKTLRASVISHDLRAEPRTGKAFDSPEELVADLRAPSSV